MKENGTSIFFEVDSNYFQFAIEDCGNTTFSASVWSKEEKRAYIPISSFDQNNEKTVYFTSSLLGIYNITFYKTNEKYKDGGVASFEPSEPVSANGA